MSTATRTKNPTRADRLRELACAWRERTPDASFDAAACERMAVAQEQAADQWDHEQSRNMKKYRITYTELGTGSTRFRKTLKADNSTHAMTLFYVDNANRKIVKIEQVPS